LSLSAETWRPMNREEHCLGLAEPGNQTDSDRSAPDYVPTILVCQISYDVGARGPENYNPFAAAESDEDRHS
jgi:hypothetical protein